MSTVHDLERRAMIPSADVRPDITSPLPACEMPKTEDLTEEGFGYFRGTWLISGVTRDDAASLIAEESRIIAGIDAAAANAEDFELLASAIEGRAGTQLPSNLYERAVESGLAGDLAVSDESFTLEDLEIGVAGLAFAICSAGGLSAASCRWHPGRRSWSDCPVVFFAAPNEVVEKLVRPVREERCGLDAGRDMLLIYGSSIIETNSLAQRMLIATESRAW